MKLNEKDTLKKLFWPEEKNNLTGNLFYSLTHEEMISTIEISVSRTKDIKS